MLTERGGNTYNGQDFQPITAHIGMFPEAHMCLVLHLNNAVSNVVTKKQTDLKPLYYNICLGELFRDGLDKQNLFPEGW